MMLLYKVINDPPHVLHCMFELLIFDKMLRVTHCSLNTFEDLFIPAHQTRK